MCGIVGIVSGRSDQAIDAGQIRKMCRSIVHRGPDEEGIYAVGNVGLGMRRLAIIDLSGGQQPIHNEDKSIWIVFNGEIYNFQELRSELESAGHTLRTHSDTETIVHLYEQYGADCVQKLRGMFAFALYDLKNQKLLLARDRLGKKPLHYALHDEKLYFGSEIKALLTVAPELNELQPDALLKYFALRYIPDPQTAFRKVRKLPPGHVLEFERGEVKTRRYWDLPKFGSRKIANEEECLELLEEELSRAVEMRLISEVPLGALLSGGVDSSLVVALMARASTSPVKTFSIGFGERRFNETEHAQVVANRFSTEHHELYVEPQISESVAEITSHLDEPFGDSSAIPTLAVCRMARKYVTVALSGDGGDEMFAGYDRYSQHVQRERLNLLPEPLGALYRRAVHPFLPAFTPGRGWAYNASLPDCDRYLDSVSVLCGWEPGTSVFSREFLTEGAAAGSVIEEFREIYRTAPTSDSISRLQYVDTHSYLPGDVLTKVDRMSMAASLEMRSPLLDHVVCELAATIPVEWKIRNGEAKYILKKLAERVGVPREVLYRKKQGFAVPLVKWFKNELREEVTRVLTEPRTLQRGFYNEKGVKATLQEHFSGRRDRSEALWLLLTFELWNRNFRDRIGTADFESSCFMQGAMPAGQAR